MTDIVIVIFLIIMLLIMVFANVQMLGAFRVLRDRIGELEVAVFNLERRAFDLELGRRP